MADPTAKPALPCPFMFGGWWLSVSCRPVAGTGQAVGAPQRGGKWAAGGMLPALVADGDSTFIIFFPFRK